MSGDGKSPAAVPAQVPVPTAARPPAVRREGAVAIGATAIGALALGALAVGALAIAKLAIGQLVLGRAKLREGRVDELRIARLIIEDLRTSICKIGEGVNFGNAPDRSRHCPRGGALHEEPGGSGLSDA